jgi:hypothetical protein
MSYVVPGRPDRHARVQRAPRFAPHGRPAWLPQQLQARGQGGGEKKPACQFPVSSVLSVPKRGGLQASPAPAVVGYRATIVKAAVLTASGYLKSRNSR